MSGYNGGCMCVECTTVPPAPTEHALRLEVTDEWTDDQ